MIRQVAKTVSFLVELRAKALNQSGTPLEFIRRPGSRTKWERTKWYGQNGVRTKW